MKKNLTPLTIGSGTNLQESWVGTNENDIHWIPTAKRLHAVQR
jgi:hypothetical protein